MTLHRNNLPMKSGDLFLVYVGMETDLIFSHGMDLAGFASYPLLETEDGRAKLTSYLRGMIDLARAQGTGVILESPTWVANRDRAAPLGYSPAQLVELNKQAVALMVDVRAGADDLPTVISANIGPRDDAYAPKDQMNAADAEIYHGEQISALSETKVDLISGYTLAYPAEAIGIVQAAKRHNLPVVIAFTVETDGRLPNGNTLQEAIELVDAKTDSYASYFMINCAHPDHFNHVLTDAPWMRRIKGIVANASRCSHAELDEATELDEGNPTELGQQLADIRARFPHINVLGGCCGTDIRHIEQIGAAAKST